MDKVPKIVVSSFLHNFFSFSCRKMLCISRTCDKSLTILIERIGDTTIRKNTSHVVELNKNSKSSAWKSIFISSVFLYIKQLWWLPQLKQKASSD